MSSEIAAIRRFIRESLGYTDEVDDGQDLLETGVLDSFNVVEMALFLQQEFGLDLNADDISKANFESLTAMQALIGRTRAVQQDAVQQSQGV